ncbi:hypothetical protein EDB83DRAFT_2413981 [Lactarius deliciosus]|nr:hypothetical protein EDB83DRAFT_2413981 [Lactarius deliciosus]
MELGLLLLLMRSSLLPLLQQAPLVVNMSWTSVAWSSSVLMGGGQVPSLVEPGWRPIHKDRLSLLSEKSRTV